MLAGREFNVSKNGRFSRAECCHVASRYLPTDGPLVVEQLNSRAYIGQFSKDGTLFVAGFQVRIHLHFLHCQMYFLEELILLVNPSSV
jgi:WD repeat-containing protein 23